MAKDQFKIPKRDAERARKVLEYEKKTEPKYRKPNAAGSCLAFTIAIAITGAILFYIYTHRQQFGRLWQRSIQPDTIPAETGSGQGY